MTERPTEQTHARLTGLDAPRQEARPEAPVLPPMPRTESNDTPSLSERLQQKLSSVRQSAVPSSAPATNGAAPDQTAVRPAVRDEPPPPQAREERPADAPAPQPAYATPQAEQPPPRTQRTRATRPSRHCQE